MPPNPTLVYAFLLVSVCDSVSLAEDRNILGCYGIHCAGVDVGSNEEERGDLNKKGNEHQRVQTS